jgi:integrase
LPNITSPSAATALRAGEVALLQLEDLDWRESSLRIASPKCRRVKVLPMPANVGQAIVDYLRHSRPTVSHRHVFARHAAPIDIPLNGPSIAQCVVCYQKERREAYLLFV